MYFISIYYKTLLRSGILLVPHTAQLTRLPGHQNIGSELPSTWIATDRAAGGRSLRDNCPRITCRLKKRWETFGLGNDGLVLHALYRTRCFLRM